MEEEKRKIWVVLISLLLMRKVLIFLLFQQILVLQDWQSQMMIVQGLGGAWSMLKFRRRSRIWRYPRYRGFFQSSLVASYSEREFKRRMRVNMTTFRFLCERVAPLMEKQRRGGGIPLENRVAVALNRLGTGNYLTMCGDLFGMSEGTASIAVRDFCAALLQKVKPLVLPQWNKANLVGLAEKFEKLHGIPFIMGAIDCSHIPLLAPADDPVPFYNRKGFYSCLLQGIVDTETLFWDYDIGWAGSLHDYSVFRMSKRGIAIMEGRYLPYKLIGDAAYPIRPYVYTPYKGSPEGLSPKKRYWNFIQSSTRMCVERAFGVLKGRWRILLKRMDIPLANVAPVVEACIVLHNLCVMHKDLVDSDFHREAMESLQEERLAQASNMAVQKICDYGHLEIDRTSVGANELIQQIQQETEEFDLQLPRPLREMNDNTQLEQGRVLHDQLAKILYESHIKSSTAPIPEVFTQDPDSEAEDVEGDTHLI